MNARLAHEPRTYFWVEKVAGLIEDLEWMIQSGESYEKAAERLGYTKPDSLARRLYRFDRPDLAQTYARLAWHERRKAKTG